MKRLIILIIPLLLLLSCTSQERKTAASQSFSFCADSAYDYIADQVFIGPRVPGSTSHYACALYLQTQLKRFGWKVEVQQGQMTNYAGQPQQLVNIIAHWNENANNRILLSAHWDTRPWADQEEEYEMRGEPILGANDGASGVGVLLEIARQIGLNSAENNYSKGIDIVLFDCEDLGTPEFFTGKQLQDTWCLGSQYWANEYARQRKENTSNVSYQFGIVLDMVGASDAVFPREYHSMEFARNTVERVWRAAQKAGYSSYFKDQLCYPITDDHYYINTIAGIPCIDIIHYETTSETGFAHYWHTHEDDMTNIDKQTLEAVGLTIMQAIQ